MKFQAGDIVSPGSGTYKVIKSYFVADSGLEYVDLLEISTSEIFAKIHDPDLKIVKRKKMGHHLTNIFK